jgi:hypothetical protein
VRLREGPLGRSLWFYDWSLSGQGLRSEANAFGLQCCQGAAGEEPTSRGGRLKDRSLTPAARQPPTPQFGAAILWPIMNRQRLQFCLTWIATAAICTFVLIAVISWF